VSSNSTKPALATRALASSRRASIARRALTRHVRVAVRAAAAGGAGGLLGLGLLLGLRDGLGLAHADGVLTLAGGAVLAASAGELGRRVERIAQAAIAGVCGAGTALVLTSLGLAGALDALTASFLAIVANTLLSGRSRDGESVLARARSAALDVTGDGFAAVSEAGELLTVNEAAIRALDLETTSEADGAAVLSERVRRRIRGLLADPSRTHFKLRTRTGRVFEAWASHGDAALDGLRTLVLRDITDRRNAESRLYRLAHYDSLTGLPNRRFFIEQLERSVRDASEAAEIAALLYVDIDRFKEINDTIGHSAGDEVLRTLAERFRERLAVAPGPNAPYRTPLAARLGGDEFAILLTGVRDVAAVEQFAQQLLALIAEPMLVASRSHQSGASVGAALMPKDASEPEALVQCADAALYAAKRLGRNRYEFYEDSFTREADRTRAIELGLREALERGDLGMLFQPKVELATERVVGFEALLRWTSPTLGVVSPSEFVPIAESRGLIGQLGAWCFEETCRQLTHWKQQGFDPLPVSVNVSSLQFSQTDLLRVVSKALLESHVDPKLVEVELTESALLEDRAGTARVLSQLRAMGVRIALDDFGTGYSALGHLSDMPLDTLKMDRTFMRDIETNETSSGIASAVIALARTLRLSVVAEGVDTLGQLELLREMGCDQVQGFIYAPPLKASDATRYLEAEGAAASGAQKQAERATLAPRPADEADLPVVYSAPRDGERRVLMLDDAARTLSPLALRLMQVGIDVHYASDTDEARLLAKQEGERIRMLIASPGVDVARLAAFTRWTARELSPAPTVVLIGSEPDAARRAQLRAAGALRVLWTPVDDAELRYWLNSAMAMPEGIAGRLSPRVPVNLMAWLRLGSRRIVGVISNLSATGAFIELEDPPPLGDSLRIEFELPPARARVFCKVVHLQTADGQRNAGIGVAFQWLDAATAEAIRSAVEERAARYLP
jgi:diguanylate cyclase (GGDEF)-like protein